MGIEPTQDASQRPANGFEDRGEHQLSNIPSSEKMLFRQGDADTFDAKRLRVARQHAHQEPEHPIDR
jgi:hypothetical protein